jgi:hypothetical protein
VGSAAGRGGAAVAPSRESRGHSDPPSFSPTPVLERAVALASSPKSAEIRLTLSRILPMIVAALAPPPRHGPGRLSGNDPR